MISENCDFGEFLRTVLNDSFSTIQAKVRNERTTAQERESSASPELRQKFNRYFHYLNKLDHLLDGNPVSKGYFAAYQTYIDKILAKKQSN